MNSFKVASLAEHPNHWQQAAQWSFEAWTHEFPSDTVQTYLDQYALAASEPEKLIEVFAAIDSQDHLLGVATLVDDDELPDAPEPGPWLAAVFVTPDARKFGVGSALVEHVVNQARELGYPKIYLYTEHQENWYASKSWVKIRDIIFLGLHHTVMQLELVD
ncbi:MAG: N-acetyltransferase [Actinobacteria bacterium]|nr:N-acetyltransferase [Actinomycetota bacterium]